jgi:hypothetical protein
MSRTAPDNSDRPLGVAVGMTPVPEVGRADRSGAGAIDKGLERALVRGAGYYRVPGRGLPVGAVLLRHGVNTRMSAVFLDVIRFPQNFGALGCVHRDASISIPCSAAARLSLV